MRNSKNTSNWNRLIRQLAIEAGVAQAKHISSHSLRRGFATEAARLGASMPAIQRHGRSTKPFWNTSRLGVGLLIVW